MSDDLFFFGTPAFALPTLDALERAGRTPKLVVTQPARPVGRGQRLQQPPVAEWAIERGIALEQPARVRARAFRERIASDPPGVAVVVAFGQIFPVSLLEAPRLGCVNVHASLLPAYRGAAPIQAAIAAGEAETGVTTMRMEKGLDTGPILLCRSTPIGKGETTPELSARLARIGGELLVETLAKLEAGEIEPQPQIDELSSYAPMLTKKDGRVEWTLRSEEIHNRLRAYTPWPGLTTQLRGETVKIGGAAVLATPTDASQTDAPPGEYLGLQDGRVAVACSGGSVLGLEVLQRAGRKALDAAAFANGERLIVGESFG